MEEAQEDGKCMGALGRPWTIAAPRDTAALFQGPIRHAQYWHLKGGGFISCQATELSDAILEGYPKSKKQFFEEVGIETDEDHNVKLPDP